MVAVGTSMLQTELFSAAGSGSSPTRNTNVGSSMVFQRERAGSGLISFCFKTPTVTKRDSFEINCAAL